MEELLEEFFDRTFEDTINEEMFSYNYSLPEEQLEDYVLSLMAIPYKEFIDYVATRYCPKPITPAEIPQISSYESATIGVTEVMNNQNDPGLECLEIGVQLFSDGKERKDGAYFKFGENHVKGAYFHGLTHCCAKKWFLTCLGRIYPSMDNEMRQYLSARTLLRNPLFHIVVAEATKHEVNIRFFMPGLSEATEKRRSSSCMHFFNIIAHQCKLEGVSLHRIYYESERKELYWIVPSNDDTFRLTDYFADNDEVDWKQRNDFAAGDTVYLYNSKPLHRITYETKVIVADLTLDEYKSAKEYWINEKEYEAGLKDNRFVRLRLTNKISQNKHLTLEHLREHGLKGNLQSSKKVDNELLDYIQSEISREKPHFAIIADINSNARFTTHLPVYSIRAACGTFNHGDANEQEGWLDVTDYGIRAKEGMFIVHAVGNSMEPRIHDGDLCVFAYTNAEEEGAIMLVESNKDDCQHVVKVYHSEQEQIDAFTIINKVKLRSLNPDYDDIVLTEEHNPKITGILVDVIKKER